MGPNTIRLQPSRKARLRKVQPVGIATNPTKSAVRGAQSSYSKTCSPWMFDTRLQPPTTGNRAATKSVHFQQRGLLVFIRSVSETARRRGPGDRPVESPSDD